MDAAGVQVDSRAARGTPCATSVVTHPVLCAVVGVAVDAGKRVAVGPIAGIVGNLTLAKMDLVPGSQAWESLENLERSMFRAQELTDQLLALFGD